jgi:hypothetical protein
MESLQIIKDEINIAPNSYASLIMSIVLTSTSAIARRTSLANGLESEHH